MLDGLAIRSDKKKGSNRETYKGFEWYQIDLNVKGLNHGHLGPIWYHSESSNIPYSLNQFLGWDFFVASYVQQEGSNLKFKEGTGVHLASKWVWYLLQDVYTKKFAY